MWQGAATSLSIGKASEYVPDYLGDEESVGLAFCNRMKPFVQRYKLLQYKNYMIVGPKVEFYIANADGERPKYEWGQAKEWLQAGYPMEPEPFLMALVKSIRKKYGEDVNHAILKRYVIPSFRTPFTISLAVLQSTLHRPNVYLRHAVSMQVCPWRRTVIASPPGQGGGCGRSDG